MIDPKDFVGGTKKEEETPDYGYVDISGSFICSDCLEHISEAKLDEDNLVIMYVCSEGHKNQATIG